MHQNVWTASPAARQLLQLGLDDTLRLLRPCKTADLHPLIDCTLSLLAPSPGTGPRTLVGEFSFCMALLAGPCFARLAKQCRFDH